MGRQFELAIWKHFKIVNILLIAVAVMLVSENASSHPDDASFVEAALHALEEQGEITEAMHTLFDQCTRTETPISLRSTLRVWRSVEKSAPPPISICRPCCVRACPRRGSRRRQLRRPTAEMATSLCWGSSPRAPFTPTSDNPSTGQSYLGIWGYASAGREYALLTHSQGLSITEVTDPANLVEIQFIPSAGGRIQRDIDTYLDPVSGKPTPTSEGRRVQISIRSTSRIYRERFPPPGLVDWPDQLDPHSAGGRRPSVRQQRGKQPGLPDLRRAGESGQSTRCLRKVGAVQAVTATTALLATIFSTRPMALAPAGGSWTSQESAAEAPPRCWERRP